MPAKSKAQQRFFGMVHAYQKGELDNPSKAIKDAAKSISKKGAKEFAKTKHKGLPNHVKKHKKKKTNENTVRIPERMLVRLIKENIMAVKKMIMEGLYDSRPMWLGVCKNIKFKFHGEWADPELVYNGYLLNVNQMYDYLQANGVNINDEDELKDFCVKHQKELENYIKKNGKKEYNPFADYEEPQL